MKILITNYEFPPLGGGASNACYFLSKELVKLGNQVSVLTSRHKSLPKNEIKDGIKIHRLLVKRKHIHKSNVFEMITYIISSCFYNFKIKKNNFDIAIAFFTIPGGPSTYILKLFKKIPFIISLRGSDVPGSLGDDLSFLHKITKPIINFLWKKAEFVVANSTGLCELSQKTNSKLDFKIIRNGVDIDFFKPNIKKENKKEIKLLFVGRLEKNKGLSFLFHSIKMLFDEKITSFKLRLVGDGPERDNLKKQAETLGIVEIIEFPLWVNKNEIVKEYQNADIFVFPSLWEGMPNVVLEAMACGLPVVATNIMGNNELIKHNINGFLVEPEKNVSFYEPLKKLFVNNEKRKIMATKSREISLEFSWQNTAKSYLELAQVVVNKKD